MQHICARSPSSSHHVPWNVAQSLLQKANAERRASQQHAEHVLCGNQYLIRSSLLFGSAYKPQRRPGLSGLRSACTTTTANVCTIGRTSRQTTEPCCKMGTKQVRLSNAIYPASIRALSSRSNESERSNPWLGMIAANDCISHIVALLEPCLVRDCTFIPAAGLQGSFHGPSETSSQSSFRVKAYKAHSHGCESI